MQVSQPKRSAGCLEPISFIHSPLLWEQMDDRSLSSASLSCLNQPKASLTRKAKLKRSSLWQTLCKARSSAGLQRLCLLRAVCGRIAYRRTTTGPRQ